MTDVSPRRRSALDYWPGLLGLAAATFQIITGVATEAVAITVAVAASCYLAAAALGRPWIAWAGILSGSVVVTLSEVVGVSWWLGLSLYGAVLVLVGLLRRDSVRPLTAEGLAMLGFGGLAVAAVLVSPRLGLALAGVALATHAGWDYIHWRRNEVVPRSLAEFCIVLDVPFGVAAIVLAITDRPMDRTARPCPPRRTTSDRDTHDQRTPVLAQRHGSAIVPGRGRRRSRSSRRTWSSWSRSRRLARPSEQVPVSDKKVRQIND